MEIIVYCRSQSSYRRTIPSEVRSASPDFLKTYRPPPAHSSLEATSSAMKTFSPAFMPALAMASSTTSMASRFDFRLGANPPSSPTPVDWPRPFRMPRSA